MLNIPSLQPPAKRSPASPDGTNGTPVDGRAPGGNGARPRVETPSSSPLAPRRFRRPSKKVMWGVGALLLVAFIMMRRSRSSGSAKPEVETAKAARGDATSTVSATGTLQAFTTIDVKSKASGTVLQMAVEEGTRVKAGQLICLIDRQDTTAQYRQAVSDVDSARAALRQAQENAQLQNQTTGPQIQQSSEGVNSAQSSLEQARQNLSLESATLAPAIQQAVEAVASAQAKLQQSEQALALQRQTSETDIDSARGGVASAQAKLESAQASAKVQPALSSAAIAQAAASVASAQANLQSSQQNLQLLRTATQPQDTAAIQAQVDQAQSDLDTAQTTLTRQQGLFAKGFVAQNTVDTAQNQVITARSALRTAQAKLDTIKGQQSAQLQQSQAQVGSAQGALSQARAALNTARTNAVQNTLKNKDVTAALAALRQAQSVYTSALANRRQISVKQSDVVAAQAAVRQAQAALKSAQANGGQVGVRASQVTAAQAAVRQAQAALQVSQANTLQIGVKNQDVAKAQAALTRALVTADNARTNLQQTRVLAPRDGVVLQKYVDEGAIIQSGQSGFSGGTSIVQLANTSRMFVDTQVDEADIAQIKPGQNVKITLDAYPDAPKTGKVRKVYPLAQTESNVTYIHVQVEIDQSEVDARLRPAMNATCDFLVGEKRDVLTVPSDAVKDEANGTVVTVIKDSSRPLWETSNQETRKVQVGVRGDEHTEILSGLKAGDVVVTKITQPTTDGSASGGSGSGSSGSRGLGMMGGGRPPR